MPLLGFSSTTSKLSMRPSCCIWPYRPTVSLKFSIARSSRPRTTWPQLMNTMRSAMPTPLASGPAAAPAPGLVRPTLSGRGAHCKRRSVRRVQLRERRLDRRLRDVRVAEQEGRGGRLGRAVAEREHRDAAPGRMRHQRSLVDQLAWAHRHVQAGRDAKHLHAWEELAQPFDEDVAPAPVGRAHAAQMAVEL